MKVSSKGVEFIKRHEGLRTTAYQDVAGFWTIGYGHLIKLPYEEWLMEQPIGEELATNILKEDLAIAERCVNLHVHIELDQEQFDALVSFTFNLGCGALERSTLRALLNMGQRERAAEQFQRWNKAGGKVWAGLTKRRLEEKRLFTEGLYET